jgi:hypothetical protein
MKKLGVIIMIALTFYLETGEEYGGNVIQMDYWKSNKGQVWVGREGIPPPENEIGPNPQYLYTTFKTGTNQTLIPKFDRKRGGKGK